MDKDILRKICKDFSTPSFIFDTDEFAKRAEVIKNAFGGNIPICFSIKANPFLLSAIPNSVSHVEVCSPGELAICERLEINPSMIIYSGVNKGKDDIERALKYGVKIVTAESKQHILMINEIAEKLRVKPKMILRLTSGNQFGIDPDELEEAVKNRNTFSNIEFFGLHCYTGTQKKKVSLVEKDIEMLMDFAARLEISCDFVPQLIEYGPGISTDYFNPPYDDHDIETLEQTAKAIRHMADKYNVSIEMGRFMSATCGTYLTSVADIKTNCGTNYVICDGGINHLKYYGQTMAMQVPPIDVLTDEKEEKAYTLCGSLCTTADILVRSVILPKLFVGDVIAFHRAGAYTVTEGIGLFLSRFLPQIILYSEKDGAIVVRDFYETDKLNTTNWKW